MNVKRKEGSEHSKKEVTTNRPRCMGHTRKILFNGNESTPKTTPSHYDLRNGKTLILQPSSKSAEESKNIIKCPQLSVKKYSRYLTSYGTGAHALGKKGHLSTRYRPSSKLKYVEQMFCLKDKIGEGSFGVVHAYQSFEDDKLYAIKLLLHCKNQNEIHNLDAVDGIPYCIQYHNAWEEGGLVYIQLDLGIMSLAEYAQKNHNISEDECWHILHDITSALVGIHERGYSHMDIKPENIVITPDGKYKLCDFGLLVKLDENGRGTTETEGDAKYIASEMLQGDVTTAGDIFSLGISVMEVALDLLLPMHGDLWQDIRNCDWRTLPKDEKRRMSIEMEYTLNWMMHSDPRERPSAQQLLRLPKIMATSRMKKARFNYFAEWYAKYQEEKQAEYVPKIMLNFDETFNSSQIMESADGENETIKTPPRRISSLLICRSSEK